MEVLEIKLNEISEEHTLRCDVKFHLSYTKLKRGGESLIQLCNLIKFRKNKPDLSSLDIIHIKYVEISNVQSDGEVNLISLDKVDYPEFERLSKKINKGDIIKPEKKSILINSVRPYLKKFVLIDDEIEDIYFTKAFIEICSYIINPKLLYYLFKTLFLNKLVAISRQGMSYPTLNEKDFRYILIERNLLEKILKFQDKIIKEIEKIEAKIKTEKQKIIPLQDVIDNVLIEYGVKSDKFKKGELEVFTSNTLSISKQNFLRCGVQYRAFWDVYDGLLFYGKTRYPIVKMDALMRLHKTKTLKKGTLDKEYILIELEDIEQRTGKILNMDRVVTEIGSDKIYFGDADLITTKLRPYLGYTILNVPEFELIGTTELLPFKVDKDKVYPEYLKYILLSNEYLEKSQFLMYGKEHPRIHPLDLLNIKIPLPPKDIQWKIISEIQEQEKINDKVKQELNDYRKQINNLIFRYLTNH